MGAVPGHGPGGWGDRQIGHLPGLPLVCPILAPYKQSIFQEWGLVSQKEAMSGEGKHFVVPEKIRSRLDNMVEKRHNSLNVALFLKISLACFIIQNVAVFCSLLLAKPIYHQPEIRSYRPVTLYKRQPVDSSVFRPLVYNNSASLQCWSPRAAEVQKKTAVIEKGLSWENITLIAVSQKSLLCIF